MSLVIDEHLTQIKLLTTMHQVMLKSLVIDTVTHVIESVQKNLANW
jgi:hypothetical protein